MPPRQTHAACYGEFIKHNILHSGRTFPRIVSAAASDSYSTPTPEHPFHRSWIKHHRSNAYMFLIIFIMTLLATSHILWEHSSAVVERCLVLSLPVRALVQFRKSCLWVICGLLENTQAFIYLLSMHGINSIQSLYVFFILYVRSSTESRTPWFQKYQTVQIVLKWLE